MPFSGTPHRCTQKIGLTGLGLLGKRSEGDEILGPLPDQEINTAIRTWKKPGRPALNALAFTVWLILCHNSQRTKKRRLGLHDVSLHFRTSPIWIHTPGLYIATESTVSRWHSKSRM